LAAGSEGVLGDDQAGRARERNVLDKAPASLTQPATHLRLAVHIARTGNDQELSGKQRGHARLSVAGIGPEVYQQKARAVWHALPNEPQQFEILFS